MKVAQAIEVEREGVKKSFVVIIGMSIAKRVKNIGFFVS